MHAAYEAQDSVAKEESMATTTMSNASDLSSVWNVLTVIAGLVHYVRLASVSNPVD